MYVMFDMKFMHFNVKSVNFNERCVLSLRVTCLFSFRCSDVDAVGVCLKDIHRGNIKDDTTLDICKFLPPLEKAWNLAAVSSLTSDNVGSECNNEIVTDMDDSDDGSLKPSSPSVM